MTGECCSSSLSGGSSNIFSVGLHGNMLACHGWEGCNSYDTDLGTYSEGERLSISLDSRGSVLLRRNGKIIMASSAGQNAQGYAFYAMARIYRPGGQLELIDAPLMSPSTPPTLPPSFPPPVPPPSPPPPSPPPLDILCGMASGRTDLRPCPICAESGYCHTAQLFTQSECESHYLSRYGGNGELTLCEWHGTSCKTGKLLGCWPSPPPLQPPQAPPLPPPPPPPPYLPGTVGCSDILRLTDMECSEGRYSKLARG